MTDNKWVWFALGIIVALYIWPRIQSRFGVGGDA